MSSTKSVIAGLGVGLIAYFGVTHIGDIFPSRGANTTALIGSEVSPALALSAAEVPNRGTKSGTNLAPGAKTVAPTLAPTGTIVAPTPVVTITPRISSPITPSASPTTIVTPRVSVAPNPTPTPSLTPTPTSIPSPTLTPTPSTSPPSVTPTPSVGTPHVVINEIAWAGTAANASDEWIELYNSGDAAQELNGWYLCETDTKILSFGTSHRINPGEFFLIERGADDLTTDIVADFATSFSGSPAGLSNAGEHLTLRDGACGTGAIIDEVGPGAWYAGLASPEYASMERVSASVSGTDPSNWATNTGLITTGQDAAGSPIRGTPKFKNSVTP